MMLSSRFKREECKRTKHDSVFSKWEILIGPSDWKDYSLGKDGVERYRIHNLPIGSCPGLYELGVAATSSKEGRGSRKYASDVVIVVYLGQGDNVRTRLQDYGRSGSHLDHGNKSEGLCPQRGPGLFKEIFSRGYSIMFRWAPMTNKKEAENMEAKLLGVFDYAWNRRGNGACRREDILVKLAFTVNSPVYTLLTKLQQWKHPTSRKKVGIKIDKSVALYELGPSNVGNNFSLPQVFKFVKSQPQLLPGDDSLYIDHKICGLAIGNGFVCRNRPVDGRQRCVEHKGKRISGTNSVTTREIEATQGNSSVCGIVLEDGSYCLELPDHGRKRCELHKGRRVVETIFKAPEIKPLDKMGTAVWITQPQVVQGTPNLEDYDNCGVIFGDGSVCMNKPILGRKRCEMHKGQRVSDTKLSTSREGLVDYNICGVITHDGYPCRRKPVSGRKRCEMHKGQRVSETKLSTSREGLVTTGACNLEDYNICGVITHDGYPCRRKPVSGRKRCEMHKGQWVSETKLSTSREGLVMTGTCNLEDYNICGVITHDGYPCRRKPVSGRKRCEMHKGKRIT